MYTIADILEPRFERTWPEAVALVQELAAQAGGLRVLPLPEDVGLSEDGALELGFSSESGARPVVALARILHALLEGIDAPENLRRLAAESATEMPAHATVESFSRALAFYERPDRASDLRALAGRLRVAGSPPLDPDSEVERLREKLSGVEPERRDPQEEAARRAAAAARRRTLTRAAVFAMALIGGAGLVAWGGFRLVDLLAPEPVVVDVAELEVEPLPVPPDAAATANARRSTRPPVALPTTGDTRPAGPVGSETLGAASAVAQPLGALPAARETLLLLTDRTVRDIADSDDSPPSSPADAIYSLADPRVQPPVLVRRVLPSRVAADPDTGYFYLLVDQFGFVEEVRLISPTNEFRERILVSAAKAWQFEPARLEGRPVRFRTRIPITFTGEHR